MLRTGRNKQRGETLVELLLAFAILSMALVTVMRTMNGGLDNLFVSGQRSQVEAHMRGQLAVLQAVHQEAVTDPNAAGWTNIVAKIGGNKTADVNADGCTYSAPLEKNRLFFTTLDGSSWTGDVSIGTAGTLTPSTVTPTPDGNSIWIEAKHTPKNDAQFTRGFYDFYIKSCWVGEAGLKQQAKMVTRLYDLEATTTTPTFDNFTLSAGPINNGASTGACASGSNGRISYTIVNPNPYRLGDVQVTITPGTPGIFSATHVLEASSSVSNTDTGYSTGTYTITATSAGGSKTMTFTMPPCVVLQTFPIGWWGSSENSCTPYGSTGCQEWTTYLWNCQPFNSEYTTGSTLMQESSSYKMRISYGNYNGGLGGSCGGSWPPSGWYPYYRINVYINGVFCVTRNLPNTSVDREEEFNLPCWVRNVSIPGGQGPSVRIEWVNDWYLTLFGYDANFRINWLNIQP